MPSSGRYSDANALASSGMTLGAFLQRPDLPRLLRDTHVDWVAVQLVSAPKEVERVLHQLNVISADNILTPAGVSLLSKVQLDLEAAVRKSSLAKRFEILSIIGTGRTSIALQARNRVIDRTVVLKVLRPSLPADTVSVIQRLGSVAGVPHLVAPIDAYSIPAKTVSGDHVTIHCLVFPFVAGTTLRDYLRTRPPVTPLFFGRFVEQVGSALAALEQHGLSHGDLHDRNILVSTDAHGLDFTLIDLSSGLESPTAPAGPTDFQSFQEHLHNAMLLVQRQLPTLSVHKFLGPKLFFLIDAILRADSLTFADVLRLTIQNPLYDQWLADRSEFLAWKFRTPQPLGLLRWEEIADPAEAVELFEPYPELFEQVRRFGNSLMYGARGSGKSTYLAALAYFPGAKRRIVEPSEILGILFSCRQGEFKQLSGDFLEFTPRLRLLVKHVVVLKILRRMLSILASAAEADELQPATTLAALHAFFQPYLDNRVSIPQVAGSSTTMLKNLAAGVARWEEFELRRLFARDAATDEAGVTLTELSLLQFCTLLRSEFTSLATTQFYLLFDDAGEPNIPRETQYVLNELVTSSNPVFCVKLSAERFSYYLRDSQARIIEETHDVTSFDIARAYGSESGRDHSRTEMKDYFAKIMRRRLEHWHYPSTDIAAYLGDQARRDAGVLPIRELIRRLADNSRDAYYAGWEVVWQIADKTARNLIEIVSEIFSRAKILPGNPSELVPMTSIGRISAVVQDRAIRAVSERRLRGLEFTPGEIEIRDRPFPLGRQLLLCATTFGAVSKRYLKASRQHTGRLDERLAIERNDSTRLAADADAVLQQLVRYAIFDDSARNVALDDSQKKPIYVFSRFLCPAFAISFRRDAHLRLSRGKFELFLLDPATFLKRGTAALQASYEPGSVSQPQLWEEEGTDE